MPRLVCSALSLVLISWLTLAPHPVGEVDVPLFPGADKLVHAVMFGWLTWMFYIDVCKCRVSHKVGSTGIWLCAVSSLIVGGAIEWLQQTMDIGRSMEWADLGADALGCLIAAILILKLSRHI
ncbi:MAG: hypothetical protein NC217_08105 [Muribaculaceae bacterium]|nr:hypothetical protein [Muribaculaceae bacterium]